VTSRIEEYGQRLGDQFNHVEIGLTDATFRTLPILRDIPPTGTGRYALLRKAFSLIIDKSTYDTLKLLHYISRSMTELSKGFFQR
jgi:hypothetical protein